MGIRGRFAAGSLVLLALLLAVGWLAEVGPFARMDGEPRAALTADPEPSAPVAPHDETTQPGLAHDERAAPPVAPVRPAPEKGRAPDEPAPPEVPREPAVVPGIADAPVVLVDPGEREFRAPLPTESMPTAEDVAAAVERAVAWLRKKQGRDGSWGAVRGRGAYGRLAFFRDGITSHEAGPTGLALYALRAAKQPLNDPVLRKGFDWLWINHALPAMSTETSALLLAVTSTVEHQDTRPTLRKLRGRYRAWASKLADHLVGQRTAQGWRYNVKGHVEALIEGGPEDLVSTHLAALALLAAQELGIKTKDEVWLDVLRFTVAQQEPADVTDPGSKDPRGFAYVLGNAVSDEGKATGGTTACGIASLFGGMRGLTDGGRRPLQYGPGDRTLDATMKAGLEAAMAWLARHWDPHRNPAKAEGAKVCHHHWLWALETAMDLHPELPARLGPYGWYGEVARGLLDRQRPDGHWEENGTWEPADVLDTCFAILFLTRATRKILAQR